MKKTNITNETRKAVYRRDGYQCAVCGDPRRLQIHHITHRSQGGGDEQMNLITLCPICHAIAHNTKFPALPEEYGPDDVEQAIVEYMSDLYADLGFTWPDGQPIDGVGAGPLPGRAVFIDGPEWFESDEAKEIGEWLLQQQE